jgi:hypothetical protein
MHRINQKAKTSITIYHSFHDGRLEAMHLKECGTPDKCDVLQKSTPIGNMFGDAMDLAVHVIPFMDM